MARELIALTIQDSNVFPSIAKVSDSLFYKLNISILITTTSKAIPWSTNETETTLSCVEDERRQS